MHNYVPCTYLFLSLTMCIHPHRYPATQVHVDPPTPVPL